MNELSRALLELERVREIASWVDRNKFFKAFWKFYATGEYKTQKECFDFMNDEYFSVTGKERYDYDTFRTLKNR